MGRGQPSGRREQRFHSALDVFFDGGTGVSHNVSASGIYFETDTPLAPGALLTFMIDYATPEGTPLRMKCDAHIVRVEGLPRGRIGVGAEIYGFAILRSSTGAKSGTA